MKLIDTIQEWITTLAVSLTLAIFINVFIVQHVVVEGHSMDPTLRDSQHLVVSKLSHSINQLPSYGDIVTIDSRVTRARSLQDDLSEPITHLIKKEDYVFVKRVIGKPGDVLEFKDNQVYRNGTKLDEPYILESMNNFVDKKIIVPDNSIFVMGDNRNHSLDSRFIGAIPRDHILGVIVGKI
jgi:signal peptidase I